MIALAWTSSPVAEPTARRAAEHLTGCHPGPLLHHCPRCGSVEHGVPSFEASAISIARTAGVTVVVASTSGPVGIDVEAAGGPEGVDPAWMAREAVGKAYGVGITGQPGADALVRVFRLPGLDVPVTVALLAPAWPEVALLPAAGISPGAPGAPGAQSAPTTR